MKQNRDNIMNMIAEKKWHDVLAELKDNEKFENLNEDPIFLNLFNQYFIDEILNESEGKILELTAIYNFHASRNHSFNLTYDNFKKLILLLVKYTNEIKYAKEFPNEKICSELIDSYNTDIDDKVRVAELNRKFTVNEINNQSNDSFVISIFKSPQEREFYLAAQKVFENSILLPNAALSTLINNNVLNKLEKNKKWHFLSTTVDLVIIDKTSNKPVLFFELDSSYHDFEEQKIKDDLKNELINESGHTLIRIRKKTGTENIEDFEKLLNQYKI